MPKPTTWDKIELAETATLLDEKKKREEILQYTPDSERCQKELEDIDNELKRRASIAERESRHKKDSDSD